MFKIQRRQLCDREISYVRENKRLKTHCNLITVLILISVPFPISSCFC